KAASDEQERPQERGNAWSGWTLSDRIAAVAIIVGFLQFLALFATVWVMIKNGHLELRAYVYFDGPNGRQWPANQPNRLSVSVKAVNGGKTWARNLMIERVVVRNPPGDPFDEVIWENSKAKPSILGPDQEIDLQFGDVSFNEFPEIRAGRLRIF